MKQGIGIFSILAALVFLAACAPHTPAIKGADGKPLAGSIAVQEKIPIGGSARR